jgi:Zn-dependent peptidase ImmA (M78 family)
MMKGVECETKLTLCVLAQRGQEEQMTATTPMTTLYAHLKTVGISKAFARKMLPDWWDDSITSSNAGLQQAQLYFSKIFNLDIASLASQEIPPRFRQEVHKFKISQNTTEARVTASAHYATAMARIALRGIGSPYLAPPVNPNELHEQILLSSECVSLSSLLEWCRTAGIPVLHIEKLPDIKMTALAIRIDGRFAVVLSRKGHPSELLFHLAHELGHIARGHLSNDGFLADQKIGTGNLDDADEKEADAYAIRLLNGREVRSDTEACNISPQQLYQAAKELSKNQRVDIGHIILNYAHTQNQFPVAKAALKFIKGTDCGGKIVNSLFFGNLDKELLSEDQIFQLHTATSYLET